MKFYILRNEEKRTIYRILTIIFFRNIKKSVFIDQMQMQHINEMGTNVDTNRGQ